MLIDLLVMGLPRWLRLESSFLSTEPAPLPAGNSLYSLFFLLYPQLCPPIFLSIRPFFLPDFSLPKDQEEVGEVETNSCTIGLSFSSFADRMNGRESMMRGGGYSDLAGSGKGRDP